MQINFNKKIENIFGKTEQVHKSTHKNVTHPLKIMEKVIAKHVFSALQVRQIVLK
jgi:hypothetical protein